MWKKERDLLVAQTLAFVQSVAGKKGDATAGAGNVGDRIEAIKPGFEAALIDAIRLVAPPDTGQTIDDVPVNIQAINVQARAFQLPRAGVPSEVRAEMQARVANFRKHQERFNRDRDEYYSATFARLRAAIGRDSASPPSRK
jgi:hypothetical protein